MRTLPDVKYVKEGEVGRDTKFYTRGFKIKSDNFIRLFRKSLFRLLLNGTRFRFYFLRGCHIATGRRKAVNICLQ